MTRKVTVWALAGLLPLAISAHAQSAGTVAPGDVKTWTITLDGKEYEVRPATPTFFGDTGLFRLSTAYTLPKGKASFSLFRSNFDRDPKGLDISIHGLSFAYGATDRVEIFGVAGLQNRVKTNYWNQAGFFNDYPFAGTVDGGERWQTGFGDVRLGAKYKILDDYRGDSVGLAARGFVKLGTADEAKGLGTGKASGGVDLILSKNFNGSANFHAAVGFEFNGDPDNFSIGNAFNWGLGVNLPANRVFQIQAELTGTSYSGADYDQTSPVDFIVGPVIHIKPGFYVRPAWSYALAYDGRGVESFQKKSGMQFSVGYHPGTPAREIYVPPPPPPPPANRPPTVSVTCDKPVLLPGESTPCRATASDPDGDPLTYQWTASAGTITGSAAEATLATAGVAAGTRINVGVKVSDGRGGTADASTGVRVEAPAAKPEARVLCDSAGFPRNLSRLNNIDKACLDDVASRLRQDPRARVIVVGHADSRERYPEVIGRKRAEAVKEYLVKQRGVEEARVSVRSAAASKPADAGTSAQARAKNRRVEVIFVPEGAQVPELDD
jgi:outer membrane protein OmpA-like peptidoglycan-associated protein